MIRRAALVALALLAAGIARPAFAEEPVPEAWRDFLHSLPADRRARVEESRERLNPEYDNLRAALAWCASSDDRAKRALGLCLAAALARYRP